MFRAMFTRPPFSMLRNLFLSGLVVALLAATTAAAESAVDLPYPSAEIFGTTHASTYDLEGERVGPARVEVTKLASGNVAVRLKSGFKDGAQISLEADLAPIMVDGVQKLRILRERSQSVDPNGTPLVILQIDHQRGEASCTDPGNGDRSVLELPTPDRVVNVPLNLLFQPLGLGAVTRIHTDVFVCLGGARTLSFFGALAEDQKPLDADGRKIREVRYRPDGESFLSWAAKAFAPKISFWMDTNRNGAYVAHRMPLYSQGPAVYVIANGVDPKNVITH